MITCENITAFHGTMVITPINRPSFEVTTDWVYKANTGCWYGNGSSYMAEICRVKEEGKAYGLHVQEGQ